MRGKKLALMGISNCKTIKMIARLQVFLGLDRSVEFPLDRFEENLIGHGPQCMVRITGFGVLSIHAKVIYREGLWWVFANDPAESIWVNGSKTQCAVLIEGARLLFGETEAIFHESQIAEGGSSKAPVKTGLSLFEEELGETWEQEACVSERWAGDDFSELLGVSDAMLELKKRISKIAKASGCILVRGESGAGKELVARAIHHKSLRTAKAMLSVNCAAIPDELMESQLFGHVKGAFTGADRDHVGFFQQADKGTLFLDEVGELNLEGQAKLLRILEGHPFLPVGGSKETQVDVRVISATNRDLREFVAERKFREDLYYRLSAFELEIPPLRDRGGDIELLAQHYLDQFKRQYGRMHLRFGAEAMAILRGYRWPGNIRQLKNVIDCAVVLAEGMVIGPADITLKDVASGSKRATDITAQRVLRIDAPGMAVPDPLLDCAGSIRHERGNADEIRFDTLNVSIWEQRLIQEALRRTGGNIPAAAELLGMARATLYRKLEKSPNSVLNAGWSSSSQSRNET